MEHSQTDGHLFRRCFAHHAANRLFCPLDGAIRNRPSALPGNFPGYFRLYVGGAILYMAEEDQENQPKNAGRRLSLCH